MAVSTSTEVNRRPVLWICVVKEPIDTFDVDNEHGIAAGFEFGLRRCTRSLPKQLCELLVLEMLRKAVNEVSKAIFFFIPTRFLLQLLKKYLYF
jgi:hypothetical protein